MNDNDDTLIKSFFGYPPAGTPWGTVFYDWRFALDTYLAKSKGLLADPTNQFREERLWTRAFYDTRDATKDVMRSSNFAANNHVIGFANGDIYDPVVTPTGLSSVSQVDEPADTLMLIPNRTRYQDIKFDYGDARFGYGWWCIIPKGSTATQCPTAGNGPIHAVGKAVSFVWIDGHAKAMPYPATIVPNDKWQSKATQAKRDEISRNLYAEYK
jgi:hypothetical protein